MYTHNLLTSASWKQEHNTPLTARPSDINSSSLHFEQGWGGGGLRFRVGNVCTFIEELKMEGGEVAHRCKDLFCGSGHHLQKNMTKPTVIVTPLPRTLLRFNFNL